MRPASQLRAALRLVARGYRARAEGPAPAAPRRRQAVERRAGGVSTAALRRYLAATEGLALLPRVEEGVLPPLFPATWEALLALELLSTVDPPLPLGAMVHAESEVLLPRPVRAADALRCRVELERADAAPGGLRLEVAARNWAPAGQLCTQARHVFRLRAPGASRSERPAPEPACTEGWTRTAAWELPASAGRRYARASGDWNPIHLWAATARPLGFRRPILQGLCTAAMVAHTLCSRRWEGDPAAVRRFRIAFRAPIPLPGSAALWAREEGGGISFRVTDAAAERLYAEGECGGGSRAGAAE